MKLHGRYRVELSPMDCYTIVIDEQTGQRWRFADRDLADRGESRLAAIENIMRANPLMSQGQTESPNGREQMVGVA